MSDTSRRDLLRNVSLAAVLGGLPAEAAQHVHHMASAEKAAGPYKPKGFNEAEYKTVAALAELIVPGAAKGNAAEFIDLLCSVNPELQQRWLGGLAWMDRWMESQHKAAFAAATAAQQGSLLDIIAYRKNAATHGPGVRFLDLARRMVVDAYYTSAAGIAEVGYQGNKGASEFKVPQEVYAYVMKRSPFGAA
jgi:hypothetical protein